MASTAFVTNTDFLKRKDQRVVADLCSDSGSPVSDLTNDPNLTQALEDASGEILLFALKGGRYSETDLNGLTGNSLAGLQWMVCVLAMNSLRLRRGLADDQPDPEVLKVEKLLESLAKGDVVFGTTNAIEKSVAQSPSITIQSIDNQNFLRDNVRYFPTRRYTTDQY